MTADTLITAMQCLCDVQSGRVDVSELDRYFAPDMTSDLRFPTQGPGLEGIKVVQQQAKDAFSEINWQIIDTAVQGNTAMFFLHCIGTHRADFVGMEYIKPNNCPTNMKGFWRLKLGADGKVDHADCCLDVFTLMVQMNDGKPPTIS